MMLHVLFLSLLLQAVLPLSYPASSVTSSTPTLSKYLCLNSTESEATLLSLTDTVSIYTTPTDKSKQCSLRFSAPTGMSLSLEWTDFSISSLNYVQVREDGGGGRVLVAAASGGASPPPVVSMQDVGLRLLYNSSVLDPHLPEAGDGAIAKMCVVPGRKASQPACELAVSCGDCLSVVGCNWCANASTILWDATVADEGGAIGACHWTGFTAQVLADGSVATQAALSPAWLCNVTSFLSSDECPEVIETMARLNANKTEEETYRAESEALSIDGSTERTYFNAVLVLALLVLLVSFTVVLWLKHLLFHSEHISNGPAVPTLVSHMARLAILFKLLEIVCNSMLEMWLMGYLRKTTHDGPAPYLDVTNSAVPRLIEAHFACEVIFFVLVPGLLYTSHVLPVLGKQVLCAMTILCGPLMMLGVFTVITHATSHWSLMAAYNFGAGTPADTLEAIKAATPPMMRLIGAPLLVHVCTVSGSTLDSSGAQVNGTLPQFLPLLFFGCAAICILTSVVSLTALYSNVDAFDRAVGSTSFPFTSWKIRMVGAVTMFCGAPFELVGVYAGLCMPLPAFTPRSVKMNLAWFVLVGIPTGVVILGATIVLFAEMRLHRLLVVQRTKITPLPDSPSGKAPKRGEGDNPQLRASREN